MRNHRALKTSGCLVAALAALAAVPASGLTRSSGGSPRFEVRSLDGGNNNAKHPKWGEAGTAYRRFAPALYADKVGTMVSGPNPRYISNRIFNSLGVDLFSERNVSQWAWVWGQTLDHTFDLDLAGVEPMNGPGQDNIPFNQNDPLERFTDQTGNIPFVRNAFSPGTGVNTPRQQVNTINSYIDGSLIYGTTKQALAWLRTGPDRGRNPAQGAALMLPGGYLPRANARGNPKTAPPMQTNGQLLAHPQKAVESGDARANENTELTAVHTLLAREHNRIVAKLPGSLTAEQKFQIARRVVGAEQQWITYTQFLPSVGVKLRRYTGYQPKTDSQIFNEFATVGYRAHSMVNGEEHMLAPASHYGPGRRAALRAQGIELTPASSRRVEITMSQNAAFFSPSVLPTIGLGPVLQGLSGEPGYKNDAQIDDTLRSVLFQIPAPGAPNPMACVSNQSQPGCFKAVEDLGALDIQRGRDDGVPTYNRLRQALGLKPYTSFTQITGEKSSAFSPSLGPDPINNPQSLAYTSLRDLAGKLIKPGDTKTRAVFATQASPLAARLKAIYGSVDKVDAFVGMVSEKHVHGTDFGPLQLAIWTRQFTTLRNGDRFFYANDPVLKQIQRRYGITYRVTLAKLIAQNTNVALSSLPANVFFAPAPNKATPQPGS
jgi:hypothetical protein